MCLLRWGRKRGVARATCLQNGTSCLHHASWLVHPCHSTFPPSARRGWIHQRGQQSLKTRAASTAARRTMQVVSEGWRYDTGNEQKGRNKRRGEQTKGKGSQTKEVHREQTKKKTDCHAKGVHKLKGRGWEELTRRIWRETVLPQ